MTTLNLQSSVTAFLHCAAEWAQERSRALNSKRLTLFWLAYLFNFESAVELNSIEKSAKFTDDSSRAGKSCHVTIAADDKAHSAEQ